MVMMVLVLIVVAFPVVAHDGDHKNATEAAYIRSLLVTIAEITFEYAVVAAGIYGDFEDPAVTGNEMLEWQHRYMQHVNVRSVELYEYVQRVAMALGFSLEEILESVQARVSGTY